jgi:hypothetical protein
LSAKQKKENVGAAVRKYSALKIAPDRVFKLAYELGEDLVARFVASRGFDEYSVLADAAPFISQELEIGVEVQKAGGKDVQDPAGKAKDALPMKPALYLQ